MQCLNLNARSLVNKSSELESIVLTHKPHIIVITETWLNIDIRDAEVTPPGYRIYRKDRDSRGGGVAIIYQENLSVSRLADIAGIECVVINVSLDQFNLVIAAFYRPPGPENNFCQKLNEFLCTCKCNSRNVLLAGDFNFPLINLESEFPEPLASNAENFVDLIIFHDLTQLVKQPTRIHGDTRSILDLYLVSSSVCNRDPQVNVLDGISDHAMVALTISRSSIGKISKEKRVVPVFARADDVSIVDLLDVSYSDFLSLSESRSCTVNDLWCFFKALVLKCVENFVPTKLKVVQNGNPWMTRDIVRLQRKAKKIRKRCRQRPSTANNDKLSAIRLQLSDSIKKAKQHFYGVSMKNFLLSSPAKFWRHFAPRKQTFPGVDINGQWETNKGVIVESFNNFFVSVFTSDNGIRPYFSSLDDVPPISSVSVSREGVLALLLDINAKKSPGIDNVPNAFLVRFAEWCSHYLTIIYNKSLSQFELPEDWKFSKIVPVPKNNTNQIPSYRPISLLCTSAKILEHIIFKHLSQFLEEHSIIIPCQHGFRKGLSTTTQLVETIHDFGAILDKRGQIDVIFVDFEKAFDRVSHPKLLLKLHSVLKNDVVLGWIEAYFSSRCQSVVIDGEYSSARVVHSGIPQGSILGPLFFLIYVNDITNDIPVKMKLFADDCVLYQ